MVIMQSSARVLVRLRVSVRACVRVFWVVCTRGEAPAGVVRGKWVVV